MILMIGKTVFSDYNVIIHISFFSVKPRFHCKKSERT